jgi:hypothetical protein
MAPSYSAWASLGHRVTSSDYPAQRLPLRPAPDSMLRERRDRWRPLLGRLSEGSSGERGRLLEDLVCDILGVVEGFRIVRRNVRLLSVEIDILVSNTSVDGFLRGLGSPIIVECKNWDGPLGAARIPVLLGGMEAVSPDVKTGLLVARNGVTGRRERDARGKIRDARVSGRNILVIDGGALNEIVEMGDASTVLERCYWELMTFA